MWNGVTDHLVDLRRQHLVVALEPGTDGTDNSKFQRHIEGYQRSTKYGVTYGVFGSNFRHGHIWAHYGLQGLMQRATWAPVENVGRR